MDKKGIGTFNVKEYGAVGDGVSLDTNALQAAIDACGANSGGTVLLPSGTYLTGTLELRDNVTFHLAADAILLGSQNIDHYAPGELGDDYHFRHCLIYARNVKHISLEGKGVIDGQGAFFPCVSRQDSIPAFRGEVPHQLGNKPITHSQQRPYVRPMLVIFLNCQHISIRGILVKNSASWGIHFIACDQVWVDGVRVRNRARPNGDGLDLESCRNVFISHCDIDCDDDAICLKSSIASQPCENFVISNCIISSHTAAVKFGTPSRGGFRNIAISNCVFYNCGMGAIKLLSVDGGTLENVTIMNISMQNVEGPIFMRLGKRHSRFNIPGFAESDTDSCFQEIRSVLRNVTISNVEAVVREVYVDDPMMRVEVDPKTKQGIFITGVAGQFIENISLNNIHIIFPGGGTVDEASIAVPEDEDMYPEQFFFGKLPAYGAMIRYARGVVFNNVCFELASDDGRPALVCDEVSNLELASFRAAGNPETSLIRFIDVQDIFIHNSRPLTPVSSFISTDAKSASRVKLEGNDLRQSSVGVEISEEV